MDFFIVIILSALLIIGLWLLYNFIVRRFSQKAVDSEAINNYINKNFNGYEIVKEFSPHNINKTLAVKKFDEQFILKITCKKVKKARREARLLKELEGSISVPRIISENTASIPGHILMSHAGTKLSVSDTIDNYYAFGKVISGISEINLSGQSKALLKKYHVENNIKKVLSKVNQNHPYAGYYYEYKQLPRKYFCHGDLHTNQALLGTDDRISIIDWESASFSYRVLDLSTALSHCLGTKYSIQFAQAIMDGYRSVHALDNKQEIKLLLSLIWYALNKDYYLLQKYQEEWAQTKIKNIEPLLNNKDLEVIFGLKSD